MQPDSWGGGGISHIKRMGMLVRNVEKNPHWRCTKILFCERGFNFLSPKVYQSLHNISPVVLFLLNTRKVTEKAPPSLPCLPLELNILSKEVPKPLF